MAQQIPLPFARFDHLDFDLYVPGQNRQAVEYLRRIATGEETKNSYLWGEPATGKSHLLQAVCEDVVRRKKSTAYIPLSEHQDFQIEMLQGLEQLDLVCMDDLDTIAGKENWEQAVFHLFNRLHEQGKPLIISAKSSPKGIMIRLPDLKSRLEWGVTWHLQTLTDQQQSQVLQQRARARGFELPPEVADYLLKRIPRDMQTLLKLLDELDIATLVEQKKLTIPFVKTLLTPQA